MLFFFLLLLANIFSLLGFVAYFFIFFPLLYHHHVEVSGLGFGLGLCVYGLPRASFGYFFSWCGNLLCIPSVLMCNILDQGNLVG